MKNVTITLDEEVARWARILAAQNNTSVSRLVGNLLKDKMQEEADYALAMEQYLLIQPTALKKARRPLPQAGRTA